MNVYNHEVGNHEEEVIGRMHHLHLLHTGSGICRRVGNCFSQLTSSISLLLEHACRPL